MNISININDVLKTFDHITAGLNKTVDASLKECAILVQHNEEHFTKGNLSKSFFTFKEGQNYVVDNTKHYAKYVEFGRGWVFPIRALALHFWIDGKEIWAKASKPMAAQDFMGVSIAHSIPVFKDIFNKHLKQLIYG